MADRFSDEQIEQLKDAFEPMFVAAQQSFVKIDEEREQDRTALGEFRDEMTRFRTEMTEFRDEMTEFRDEMIEFRDEANGHFASLEKRFQVQQSSIDDHDQQLGALRPTSI